MPSLWVSSGEGKKLVPLEAAGYVNEGAFQQLLAENPSVLAGALDDEDSSWLLIAQELAIKAEESDVGTWKLDHLFIASDGTPVLVEVKRSSDARARREVVAQMLDYAASFAFDWSADRLRARREQRFGPASSAAAASEMDQFLSGTTVDDEEQFWAAVQTKIEAEELRLLFVADHLSTTLVRIIEYLNRQLRSTEVLGVEVARHVGASGEPVAYQPLVRGRSSAAAQRKAPAARRSPEEFEQALLKHQGQKVVDAVNELVEKASGIGGFPSISRSEGNPALYINFHTNGGGPEYWPLLVNPRLGKLIVRVIKLRRHPAFADQGVLDDLLDRVSKATGAAIQGNADASPWFDVASLTQPGVIPKLIDVLKWVKATADSTATAVSPSFASDDADD